MARFEIVLATALLIAGCSPAPPVPGPSSAAPVPKIYTCEQNRAAAKEYDLLPVGGELRRWTDDYRIERKALRAFHNLPEPLPC